MVLWHQYQETENIRIVRNHCFFGKFEEVIKWQILDLMKTLQIIGSQVR